MRPSCLPVRRRLAGLTAAALVLAACGDGTGSAGAPEVARADVPTVAVTTSIWADVVANVACSAQLNVVTIVPAGGDPHGFEPSLRDRGVLDDAAIVVANGLGLEEGLADTLDSVADGGTPVFEVAARVETLESEDGADPHIWFDPARVASVLPQLGEELVLHGGLDADGVRECIDDYQVELAGVDEDIAELVATVPEDGRKLVTNHDSLGYFADRYGFEIIGTVIPASSSLAETNPAQLEALAATIEREGVGAIFVEAEGASDDAEALADRVGGVEVIGLITGGLGDQASGAATYVAMLRTNARSIADGLG